MAHGDPTFSGIYAIKNVVSGRVYVGSAVNIAHRWRLHRLHLRQRRHHSRFLQRSWNLRGEAAFEFGILERVVEAKDLIAREQFWFDRLRPYDRATGYNVVSTAGSTLAFKHTSESKKKMGDARRGKPGSPRTPEQRAKIAARMNGMPSRMGTQGRANVGRSASLRCKGVPKSPEHRTKISVGVALRHRINRNKAVDGQGFATVMTETSVIPFGKHKGKSVETLLADRDYLRWIMGQPGIMQMLQAKHPTLFNIITIGAPQSDDTPDHNRLQARFTDRAFQLAFVEIAIGQDPIEKARDIAIESNRSAAKGIGKLKAKFEEDVRKAADAVSACRARAERPEWVRSLEDLPRYEAAVVAAEKALSEVITYQREDFPLIEPAVHCEFENGYDVGMFVSWDNFDYLTERYSGMFSWPLKQYKTEYDNRPRGQDLKLRIEIKPRMGDDFPSVLRQMKRNGAWWLLVGSFDAEGASLEQVRLMFGGIKIVLLSEIEEIMMLEAQS